MIRLHWPIYPGELTHWTDGWRVRQMSRAIETHFGTNLKPCRYQIDLELIFTQYNTTLLSKRTVALTYPKAVSLWVFNSAELKVPLIRFLLKQAIFWQYVYLQYGGSPRWRHPRSLRSHRTQSETHSSFSPRIMSVQNSTKHKTLTVAAIFASVEVKASIIAALFLNPIGWALSSGINW
jgi:hypothetical protein